MTSRPLLAKVEFKDLWATINAAFPPFRQTYEELLIASQLWYAVLGGFTARTLQRALVECTSKSQKRPTPFDLREAATLIVKAQAAVALVHHAADSRSCPCGCGGRRWFEVEFDNHGKECVYPSDTAPAFGRVLAGSRKLRSKFECVRQQVDIRSGECMGVEEGLPVYRPHTGTSND